MGGGGGVEQWMRVSSFCGLSTGDIMFQWDITILGKLQRYAVYVT